MRARQPRASMTADVYLLAANQAPVHAFHCLRAAGRSRGEATRELAAMFGVPKVVAKRWLAAERERQRSYEGRRKLVA
jgi:hypothetical protein